MYVQTVFDVDDQSKKYALSSVAVKWRQFKSGLAKKYVYSYKNNPDKLRGPPKQLSFIKDEDWKKFVAYRLSHEFKVINSVVKFYY